MNVQPEIKRDRRDWFVGVGRMSLLGGLSALSLHLWSRSASDDCINNQSPCAACQLWKGCQLPKAKASKAVTNHKKDVVAEASRLRATTQHDRTLASSATHSTRQASNVRHN